MDKIWIYLNDSREKDVVALNLYISKLYLGGKQFIRKGLI